MPGVSHAKLPLKRRRAAEDVAATLASVALHYATTLGRWLQGVYGWIQNSSISAFLGSLARGRGARGTYLSKT